jgi:antitoxin HicB
LEEDGDLPEMGEPEPSDRLVPLGGLLALKAALRTAMRQAGVSNTELARRLGCDEKEVRRLLDPRHGSRLPPLEAALAALGKRVVIEVGGAA